MSDFFTLVALLALLVWAALLLSEPKTRVPLLYGAGILVTASSAGVLTGSLVGTAARPTGVALIALAALSSPHTRTARAPRLAGQWAFAICAPLAVYVVVTTAPQGQWSDFTLYIAALSLPAVLIIATGGHLPRLDLRRGLVAGLTLILAASLVLGLAHPGIAIEGGRLRGLLENANGLGFIAFLLGAIAVLVPTHWSRASLALSAIALLWSASRASALALLVVGVLELWRRGRHGLVIVLAVTACCTVVLSRLDVALGPLEGLLRTTDSRTGSLDAALADFGSSPVWGVGAGNESAIIASTPLRALSNGGLLGLLCVVTQGFLMLRVSLFSGRAAAFATAGLAHSLFEGWLLSPSSPFLLIFACVWLLVARESSATSDNSMVGDLISNRPALTGRESE